MFKLSKTCINKLLTKPTKKKDKEKEATIYWEILPLEAFVNQEGWKVSLLEGMYATKLSTLIQVIWLKGSWFTYVAKKLMSFVLLVKQRVKVNWSAIVFNNLYNKLWGLSAPTKFSASRDNTKFGAAQIEDILFWNCFPIDLTFIWMELYEEKEGLVKPLPKAQIAITTKIPKVHP